MAIPLTQLPRDARRAAKSRLVAGMNAGLSWRAATAVAGITTSETTAHHLRRRVRHEGDSALDDQRHGYGYKLPPAVRQWLLTYCREHPHIPSHALQTVLREHCDVLISVGYLNQVRAALGVRFVRPTVKKTVTVGDDQDTAWHAGVTVHPILIHARVEIA